ncbi:MAG: HAMP domain-containing histidine kinase [Nitrospirae bacterium]|nr:HAMP domain-containing histidine kinase [Nitrospirota bacterium]
MERLSVKKLTALSPGHLLWICVISSEVLAMIISSAMDMILNGAITYDYLITGAVTSFLVSFIVTFLVLLLIGEIKRSELALCEKSNQLEELNKTLELKVKEEIEKSRQREQLLVQQSKLAAMGEMLGSIAHQWRQPLSAISVLFHDLKNAYEYGELDKKYLNNSVKKAMQQIEFMSHTIDDFRNYFKPAIEKVPYELKPTIKNMLSIISPQLVNNAISLKVTCKIHDMSFEECDDSIVCKEATIFGYPNELIHVIINIISNARDAILEKRANNVMSETQDEIEIEIDKLENNLYIRVKDDAGGIADEIKDKIFEPYFSTKTDTMGTGLGLYMSKVIVENNMGGKLYCENTTKGAMFTIKLKQFLEKT